MKVRIISALVGIVLLVGVLACPYTLALAITAALLSAVAVWELMYNTGIVKNRVQVIGGMLCSAAGVMIMYLAKVVWNESLFAFGENRLQLIAQAGQWMKLLLALPLIYGVFTAILWVINRKKMDYNAVCYGFLIPIYPTLGFGCLALLREFPSLGLWPLLLVMVIAWVSDTGAYFVGTFFGKHKMAPKISPKKSWEGFFGGWVISVLASVGLFILRIETETVAVDGMFRTLQFFLPVVVILAPLSVVGDLCASWIKRHTGIKDYGNIMPGHGGVMDRFDSIVFIAPMLYFVLHNQSEISRWLANVYNTVAGWF